MEVRFESINNDLIGIIEEIKNNVNHIKRDTSNVWGKEVRILRENKEAIDIEDRYYLEIFDLETYIVEIKLKEFNSINKIKEFAIKEIIKIEEMEVEKLGLNREDVELHQLHHWGWLNTLGNGIVRGRLDEPKAVLVMYGKFLPKLKEN